MAGWRECVLLMTVGETRRCWIPQALAYDGQPGRPTGTVVFDIELVDTRANPDDSSAGCEGASRGRDENPERPRLQGAASPASAAASPPSFDSVSVHYTGWTTDGKMFDSSVAAASRPRSAWTT